MWGGSTLLRIDVTGISSKGNDAWMRVEQAAERNEVGESRVESHSSKNTVYPCMNILHRPGILGHVFNHLMFQDEL